MQPSRIALALPLLVVSIVACSERAADGAPSRSSAGAAGSGAATTPGKRVAVVRDERFLALAEEFERGRVAEAEVGLLALPASGGLDGQLLLARIASARGDEVAALRMLEAAKREHPDDASVCATAAELHAAAGRLPSAEDEIRAGLALDPESADLRRARGVLLICKQGGAEAGLVHLLAARAADPKLPFARRPLAEAHRLVATLALAKQDPELALQHVSAALVELPDHADAKLLGADAHMLLKHFDEALAIYEELLKQGRDVGATLAQSSKTAATAALLAKDRPLAIARFLRARELGLGGDALGFGVTLLADECKATVERGWTAYDAQDLAASEQLFAEALRLDPSSLDARRALGTALYARGDAEGAAVQWRLVVDTARARGIELSAPVYLDLARALHRLQRFEELRELLQRELEARPDGAGAEEAREMLKRLESTSGR